MSYAHNTHFSESTVLRDAAGRFDEKAHSAPESTLARPLASPATDKLLTTTSALYSEFYKAKDRMLREELSPALAETVRSLYPTATRVNIESYTLDDDVQNWYLEDVVLSDGTTVRRDRESESDDSRFETLDEDIRGILYSAAETSDDLETAGATRGEVPDVFTFTFDEAAP